MTSIRKEVLDYIDDIPDVKLEALKPLLLMLSNELFIETDLTDDEKAIIRKGREEYKKGGFVPLESI